MLEPSASRPVLVLGIGSPLCSDDGLGGAVIARLDSLPELERSAECLDAGTGSLALLSWLEGRRGLIAVDAMYLGSVPGTVSVFEGAHMDAVLSRACHRTAHELGLRELLIGAALTFGLPSQRALVAVQPENVGLGTSLSSPVQAAVPAARDAVLELIARWSFT